MAAAAGSDNGRAGGGDALKKRRGKAPKAYSIWDGEASVWWNAAGEPRPEGQRRRNNAAQRRPSASMRRRRAPRCAAMPAAARGPRGRLTVLVVRTDLETPARVQRAEQAS